MVEAWSDACGAVSAALPLLLMALEADSAAGEPFTRAVSGLAAVCVLMPAVELVAGSAFVAI